MSITALLSHIDRDTRRQARAAAGSIMARPLPARDARICHWGGVIRYPFTLKPVGVSIPDGVVVIAVRRDTHGMGRPLLVEAYEGDRAAFASFPQVAKALGATELHVGLAGGTILDRIIAVRELTDRTEGRVAYDCFDRGALIAQPLVLPTGAFDRCAVMKAACAIAKARRSDTGEAWAVCLSIALKAAWTLAKAARAASAH